MKVNASGFSLVELLIAMTILLMVTFVGTYGYSIYSRFWERELGDFAETFAEIKGVTSAFSVLKNIKPYVITNTEDKAYYYFEGGKSVIRSVINQGLGNPQYPAVFELKVEQSQGQSRLIYREAPMMNKPVYNQKDIGEYSFEVELLSGFSDISFEFYGWPNFNTWIEQELGQTKDLAQWYGYYSGEDTQITPNSIRVSIVGKYGASSLELEVPDFSEMQLKRYFTGDE